MSTLENWTNSFQFLTKWPRNRNESNEIRYKDNCHKIEHSKCLNKDELSEEAVEMHLAEFRQDLVC